MLVALCVLLLLGAALGMAPGRGSDESPATVTTTVTVEGRYRGQTAAQIAWRYRKLHTKFRATKAELRRRWEPTVLYALRLASAVFDIPYSELSSVSACESHHYPFATNGRYKGIFQLSWAPFGFSPFDPVANALSAAATVKHDGSWRQWECKP